MPAALCRRALDTAFSTHAQRAVCGRPCQRQQQALKPMRNLVVSATPNMTLAGIVCVAWWVQDALHSTAPVADGAVTRGVGSLAQHDDRTVAETRPWPPLILRQAASPPHKIHTRN